MAATAFGIENSEEEFDILRYFIKTGKLLNYKMQYRQSVTCFTSALTLITEKYQSLDESTLQKSENLKEFKSDVKTYCTVLTCAVQTYLFLGLRENANSVLHDYRFNEILPHETDTVKWTLGSLLLDVGTAYVENHDFVLGKTILEESKNNLFSVSSDFETDDKKAAVLSVLGYSSLCLGHLESAEESLLEAICLWRKLTYPLYAIDMIINAMRTYIECKIRCKSPNIGQHNVCTDMLRLHNALYGKGMNCQIPEAFTYLGTVAFQKEQEKSSLAFFEEALNIYKKMSSGDCHKETILKLLRSVGVASYNCRNYQNAAKSYKECLDMIKQSALNSTKLSQVAECCAALGFTFSRLRDFDKMLEYYEKALELQMHLSTEDLELIETNIGSLYHVKAVLCQKHDDPSNGEKYLNMAQSAFTTALKYSWKSFPYVNYGYYLLCQRKYNEAVHTLQQGYLNGLVDKDTIEFDHTEDPILLDDLQRELADCEDIRMPSTIISLYLKTLAQHRLGEEYAARDTANHLKHELQVCKFENYYTEGFGLDRMKALCHSLSGYAYCALEMKLEAKEQFQKSLDIMPQYGPAAENLKSLC